MVPDEEEWECQLHGSFANIPKLVRFNFNSVCYCWIDSRVHKQRESIELHMCTYRNTVYKVTWHEHEKTKTTCNLLVNLNNAAERVGVAKYNSRLQVFLQSCLTCVYTLYTVFVCTYVHIDMCSLIVHLIESCVWGMSNVRPTVVVWEVATPFLSRCGQSVGCHITNPLKHYLWSHILPQSRVGVPKRRLCSHLVIWVYGRMNLLIVTGSI